MKENKKNNNAVSFIRVIAMLSVITSHVLVSNNIYDYSVFDFSRSAFLLISGFLYSNKNIEDKKGFLYKRILKILLPMWIWSLFVSIVEAITSHNYALSISSFLITFFNLQGLNSIILDFSFFNSRILPQVALYWFITVIFICYVIMVLIKGTKFDRYIKKNKFIFISILVAIQLVFALFLNIQLGYLFAFFIGYVFYSEDEIDLKKVIVSFCLVLGFGILRIILRRYIDGSLLYNEFILPSFNTIAAVFITVLCLYLQKRTQIFNSLYNNYLYKKFESDSYFLYITHDFFLYGTFRIFGRTNNSIVDLLLFIILAVISSKVVKTVSSLLTNRLIRRQL